VDRLCGAAELKENALRNVPFFYFIHLDFFLEFSRIILPGIRSEVTELLGFLLQSVLKIHHSNMLHFCKLSRGLKFSSLIGHNVSPVPCAGPYVALV
jgi:hypothetical protein